ncbi:uncharacterized protein HMPREF1541_08966 [Cyphellophora europaea CBS 101466]|uniref:Mid2 domain-containing protein n=1 Tax=Cyphellophora europaea (strain CBS 101466) TaxID=1220924 RepID=W2RLV2_CYPE1|nr:uncharacterized protein HMPREF1541_08966 [Cyphellophora europaea CBS 101466]ETN36688.1 hypothetical protein HMPREF1541_08966 [Cyphellophora europaea CBS 101466]
MRSTLVAFAAFTAILPTVTASIIPNLLRSFEDLQDVRKRCDNPCGFYGQVCCPDGSVCYTDDNNEAACSAGGSGSSPQTAAGSWQYITTTYVMTDLETVTTVLSTFVPSATSGGCEYSKGETQCGDKCCAAGEFCESSGKCKDAGSGSSGLYSSIFTVTTVTTNTAEPPLRPTSDTLVTITATGTAGEITTTQGFISPTATGGAITAEPQNGGGGGLSAGAIAGIVIGVIAALIILILICLCCCAKGVLDAILGIFGLGPKKRRREEVEVYESHHHHGSRRGRSASAAGRRTWFGTRPKKSSVVEEKKSSSWGRGAGVAAFLGGLALILGLKRRRDRKDDRSSTGYGSSYYSDYTSSEYRKLLRSKNAKILKVEIKGLFGVKGIEKMIYQRT